MQNQLIGGAFIVLLGIVLSISHSSNVFEQPVSILDIATSPRFLIRRKPFFLAKTTFIVFCLAVYAFALVFYRQIPGLIQFLPSTAQTGLADVKKAIGDAAHPSLIVTAAAITVGFFNILQTDFRGNVIYRFRSLVYSSIAVPFACKRTSELLRDNLKVPAQQQSALAADAGLHVELVDFNLPRADVRRQWAELAYLNRWVGSRRDAASGGEIFSDASFDFSKLRKKFIALRELVHLFRSGHSNVESYEAMAEMLGELRSLHARYVSCLLLTSAASRRELYAECRRVGIDPGTTDVGDPLVYSAMYVITLAATVVLGPYLFAVGYDIRSGVDVTHAVFNQNIDYVQRWLISGLAVYFSPIFFILLIRNIAWRISPVRTCTSLVTYAWILIAAFLISTLGSAIVWIVRHRQDVAGWEQVLHAAWVATPWSIGPALTSLYINYYLDRQADPAKEDIIQVRETIVARLLSALGFTTIIVVLSLLIVAHRSFSGNTWPQEEIRIIIVGTIALMTFSLCLVAQFGLRKHRSVDEPPAMSTALAEV